jgi:hypothetical protein
MNEMFVTMAAILFLFGWYGLIMIVAYFLAPTQKLRFVWCRETGSFSLVETLAAPGARGAPFITHCLLWPEFESCKRRCVR